MVFSKAHKKELSSYLRGLICMAELVSYSELFLACLNSATPTAPQERLNRDHWVTLGKSER